MRSSFANWRAIAMKTLEIPSNSDAAIRRFPLRDAVGRDTSHRVLVSLEEQTNLLPGCGHASGAWICSSVAGTVASITASCRGLDTLVPSCGHQTLAL